MYPLEFKDGNPVHSLEWEQAIIPEEIQGPIILVAQDKCVSNLELEPFQGEPTSVDQVLVATWIGDKLTLRNAQGYYLECINEVWTVTSKAVSPAGLLSIEEDPVKGWSFYNQGRLFKVGKYSSFRAYIKSTEIAVEIPSIIKLEEKAGRSLMESEALKLYKALDRGELHNELMEMRGSTRF